MGQKIVTKQEFQGVFKIPCTIGKLGGLDAVADQGSNVNLMSLSTYSKLTNEAILNSDIKLSFADHSYEYPFGIAKDVLINVDGFLYPVDFMLFDRYDKDTPIILGGPFLATARAQIDYERGSIVLRKGKHVRVFPTTSRKEKGGTPKRRRMWIVKP